MTPSSYDTYTSPLAVRNASRRMLTLWSARHKFNWWRRIWLAVAEAEHAQGLPVTAQHVSDLRRIVNRGISDEEIRSAEVYEKELRHDVMAHVHALADACPSARGIIHLGMTSQDVVCNADLNILFEALTLIDIKAARLIVALGEQAERWKSLPTLGFTHYQPAQPVTVGRRCAMWAHDVDLTREHLRSVRGQALRLRGLRGATGTQASFAALLAESGDRGVDELERQAMSMSRAGNSMEATYTLIGQTYPRIVDALVLGALASMAAVLHRIATDIRLLCNRKELDEPFESLQIGSSAMPYKRNPMRCERICGLSRFVMSLVGNAYDTAATQWLERTLDDSSNRRLSLPESFLALDGSLDLMHNVASGLVVHEATVSRNLHAELPFLATENILMACVQLGADRQKYHEFIRIHAQAAGLRVKNEGLENDLLDRLRQDRAFWGKSRGGMLKAELNWNDVLEPARYIGRSIAQTETFISTVVLPIREAYASAIATLDESAPKV